MNKRPHNKNKKFILCIGNLLLEDKRLSVKKIKKRKIESNAGKEKTDIALYHPIEKYVINRLEIRNVLKDKFLISL